MYLNLCIFSGIGRSKKSYSNFPWRRELCWIQKRCLNSNCKVRFSSLLLSNFKSPCRSFLLFILLSAGSWEHESWNQLHCHTNTHIFRVFASPFLNLFLIQRFITHLTMEHSSDGAVSFLSVNWLPGVCFNVCLSRELQFNELYWGGRIYVFSTILRRLNWFKEIGLYI